MQKLQLCAKIKRAKRLYKVVDRGEKESCSLFIGRESSAAFPNCVYLRNETMNRTREMNFSRILNEMIHRRASSHLRNTCTVLANGWKGHASRIESRILRGDPEKNFESFRIRSIFSSRYSNHTYL